MIDDRQTIETDDDFVLRQAKGNKTNFQVNVLFLTHMFANENLPGYHHVIAQFFSHLHKDFLNMEFAFKYGMWELLRHLYM